MRTLKEVILLKLKVKQKIDWYLEDDAQIAKKVSYNQALDDIKNFIDDFEDGKVEKEFLNQLEKL